MEANNGLFKLIQLEGELSFLHLIGTESQYLVIIDDQGPNWYRVFSESQLNIQTQLIPLDDNLIPYSIQKTIYLKISARSQLDTNHTLSPAFVIYKL
jgi:hypothetical protein